MSRIIVLSNGAPAGKSEVLQDTAAMVTSGVSEDGAAIFASFFGVPCVRADCVFRLSPQSLRFPPTRTALRREGVALYCPLTEVWLKGSNWPLARGNSPALLTAYVLALALGAKTIDYRLARRDEVVPMNHFLLKKFKEHGITTRFLT